MLRRQEPLGLSLLLAVLVALSCLPHRTPPPELSLEPLALLDMVRQAQEGVRSVQGEARVRFRSPRGSGNVKQLAAAEAPDRVRLEELDFFGNPALVLVTSGGRFTLYDAREKVLYRGQATPENLSRLLPVPLTAQELATFLLGSAPLLGGGAKSAVPEGAEVRLLQEEGDVSEDLWIGAGALVDRAARRVAGGKGAGSFEVTLSDRRERGGVLFPGSLSLSSAPGQIELELSWSDVTANGALDPRLFEPLSPRGAREVELF